MLTASPNAPTKIISWSGRSWVNRELQAFCGTYELDQASGLYFASETPKGHRRLISRLFLRLPEELREAALYLGLTVSTTSARKTRSGDQSAVYGAWDRGHAQISPHLEMTETSLSDALAMPHLLHECAHLFWSIQSAAAKARYTRAMVALVVPAFVEVTTYAQHFFDEWQDSRALNGFAAAHRENRALEKWVTESFCESAARLHCPDYKAEEGREVDDLLLARREAMERCFTLSLDCRMAVA